MPVSTALITDISTVITNGPSVTTQAAVVAAAGPIMDYKGNCASLKLRFQELAKLVNGPLNNGAGGLVGETDAADSANLLLLQKVAAAVNGTATPSSAAITDISTVITNGPSATTQTNAATSPSIQDYKGNCNLAKLILQECAVMAKMLQAVTSVSDDSANRTLLSNIQLTLV